jgi:hypothetical protein
MASSTDRYCSSMPAPHSLPHHLLPPCSSLRRSSLALNGSTTACRPPTTLPCAVVGAPTPESSVAALTVPPGWLDRVVHNRIHGRRGLIWKQPVMSSMAGPPMAGAQCEGGRSSHV